MDTSGLESISILLFVINDTLSYFNYQPVMLFVSLQHDSDHYKHNSLGKSGTQRTPCLRRCNVSFMVYAAASFVDNLQPRDHVTSTLLTLHWLPVRQRIA